MFVHFKWPLGGFPKVYHYDDFPRIVHPEEIAYWRFDEDKGLMIPVQIRYGILKHLSEIIPVYCSETAPNHLYEIKAKCRYSKEKLVSRIFFYQPVLILPDEEAVFDIKEWKGMKLFYHIKCNGEGCNGQSAERFVSCDSLEPKACDDYCQKCAKPLSADIRFAYISTIPR